jgi:uncharacterized protein
MPEATWDDKKRRVNIRSHGLDFVGCEAIWDDFTITREDIRRRYDEQRLVAFGRLHGQVVVVVYTDRRSGPHIISLRKAEKYEARYYIAEANRFWEKN